MTAQRAPQPRPLATGAPDPLGRMTCSHCRMQINKFGRTIRLTEEHAETFGDAPNRVGRTVISAAAVCCSMPCMAGWIADHYPQP